MKKLSSLFSEQCHPDRLIEFRPVIRFAEIEHLEFKAVGESPSELVKVGGVIQIGKPIQPTMSSKLSQGKRSKTKAFKNYPAPIAERYQGGAICAVEKQDVKEFPDVFLHSGESGWA